MAGRIDRETAERELTKLIERALRSVPHIRLDRVQTVTSLFEKAINVLEANLDGDEAESDDDDASPKGSNIRKAQTLVKLRDYLDVADVEAEEDKNEEKQQNTNFVRPLNKIGRGVTKDYSSPSLNARRIGGAKKPAAASSRAGLGLGAIDADVLDVGRKDSRAKRFARDSDGDSSSEDESASKPTERAAPPGGLAPDDNIKVGLGGKSHGDDQSKLIARVGAVASVASGGQFTRDYSSPSLGNRRIGAKKMGGEEKPASSRSRGSARSEPESMNSKSIGNLDRLQALAQLDAPAPKTVISDEESSSPVRNGAEFQLVQDRANALSSELPRGMNSPKQIMACSKLVNIAHQPKGDLPSTPKPAFLKRLDAPDSNHAKIEAARSDLTSMLQKAMKKIPRVKLSAYEQVYAKLLRAVEELEGSTTTAKNKEWQPPDM